MKSQKLGSKTGLKPGSKSTIPSSAGPKVLSIKFPAPKPPITAILSTSANLVEPSSATITTTPTVSSLAPVSKRKKIDPFPFLDLPSELRLEVYRYFFQDVWRTIDLDPENHRLIHKKLGLFKTCRMIRYEASDYFYSSRTFRVFPCHPGRYFKTKKPLLARMKPNSRAQMTTLEVRLGPGWSQPPRGWVVNDALGLQDCAKVYKLKIFVECDPGESVFKGFRQENGFFEAFSSNLLTDVISRLPDVRMVELDAWESVKKCGNLMQILVSTLETLGMEITWGPERGWGDDDQNEVADKGLDNQFSRLQL
ncbi:hypothetical protein BROUX41_001722 [Berkeleyomyces rouxiae]|uniref:uncharacterized protein n=1 Tax=Berkeleyomyces rouxiae TaxID=2035830 RepID=UPI003B7A95A9